VDLPPSVTRLTNAPRPPRTQPRVRPAALAVVHRRERLPDEADAAARNDGNRIRLGRRCASRDRRRRRGLKGTNSVYSASTLSVRAKTPSKKRPCRGLRGCGGAHGCGRHPRAGVCYVRPPLCPMFVEARRRCANEMLWGMRTSPCAVTAFRRGQPPRLGDVERLEGDLRQALFSAKYAAASATRATMSPAA
jgi:hypothetical protein